MFGFFSISKIIFTLVVVVLVWQGFKWLSRRQDNLASGSGGKGGGESAERPADGVEEMVKCSACGTFVSPSSRSCGRDDCPYPG